MLCEFAVLDFVDLVEDEVEEVESRDEGWG